MRGAGVYSLDDLTHLNLPQRMLLAWFYRRGELPLWNPFNFGGQPFLAAGQSGPLYLPNAVFLWLPAETALKVSYLGHLWLAASGMYAAVYQLFRSRLAGLVAGTSFITCGFVLGHQIHTQMFDAVCWLPVVFWLALCVLRRATPVRVCAMGAAYAMQIYAGHPQITFYTGLILILYTGVHAALGNHAKESLRPRLVRSAWVLGGMGIALLLAAAQWLPTMQLVTYSSRQHESPAFLLFLSMLPQALAQFLSPFGSGGGPGSPNWSQDTFAATFGSPLLWEFTCYAGIVVLTLAAAACLCLYRRAAIAALGLIAVVGIGLALGGYGPLSLVLAYVPGFDMFRVPARYVLLTDFAVALLAAAGIAYLSTEDSRDGRFRQTGAMVTGAAVILLAVCKWALGWSNLSLTTLALSECLLGVTLLAWLWRGLRRWRAVVLTGLAVVDCVGQSVCLSRFPLTPTSPLEQTAAGPGRFLSEHLGVSKPYLRAADLGTDTFMQDQSAAFQMPFLNGYDSLVPAWYDESIGLTWSNALLLGQPRDLLDALDVRYVLTPVGMPNALATALDGSPSWSTEIKLPTGTQWMTVVLAPSATVSATDGPLYAITMENGSHHMTEWIFGSPDLSSTIHIPSGWPRTPTHITIHCESWNQPFTVHHLVLGGTSEVTIPVHARLAPAAWSLVYAGSTVDIWKNPDPIVPAWLAPSVDTPLTRLPTSVQQVHWEPNASTWRVSAKTGGCFVLSQMFDPNWTARVDGHRVALQRVGPPNGQVLTGVPLTAGTHTVSFSYHPAAFELGALVSGVSAIGVASVWLVALYRRRRWFR
ncbi:hypothetical protein GCM10025857_09460 [Alicyclobacillus contaminans]|nr:hypothetical protein GCM10025857_09460 [Alicyclobacillus contaminans]